MLRLTLFTLISILFLSDLANAQFSREGQLRLFTGSQTISPQQVNSILQTNGISQFENLSVIGLEVNAPLTAFFRLGFRLNRKSLKVYEVSNPINPSNPYFASIMENNAYILTRLSIITSPIFFIDAFGGTGYKTLSLEVRNSAGEGTYTQPNIGVTPVTTVGASVGAGFGRLFLFAEAGLETGLVSSLQTSGTTASTIQQIDTSGRYVTFGLVYSGLSVSGNPKGAKTTDEGFRLFGIEVGKFKVGR